MPHEYRLVGMIIVLFCAGVLLLIILLLDVHSTVFIPRGGAGVISRWLYRLGWVGWKWIGSKLPQAHRRRFLAQLGPVLVPLTVVTWGVVLVASFALMYVPWMSRFEISPAESGPMSRWALALYYSGYSAATLGVGDVVPDGTIPRFMAVAEAMLGFFLFTVSVTYLLSVYNARNQSSTLALAVSRYVGRRDGEDPVSLLSVFAEASGEDALGWFRSMVRDMAALVELRGQYPLLHYFHEPADDRAMPIALSDVLMLTTLCRVMLDPERYPALAGGPAVVALDRIGRHYLAEFDRQPGRDEQRLEAWRRHRYDDARRRLAEAHVALRDEGSAWQRFRDIAATWDVADEQMREWLGYPTRIARADAPGVDG